MKNGALPIVLLLAFSLSGCVTSSSHTKKGDQLTAKIANQNSLVFDFLENKFPGELGNIPEIAKETAGKAKIHAEQDPTPPMVRFGAELAGDIIGSPYSGPVGVITTMAISYMAYRRKKKQFTGLADDLESTQDPDLCKALRKGII